MMHTAAMTTTEVATKLRQFNEWRRGDYEPSEQPEPPNPYEVGLVIDAAVEMIDRLEDARTAWKEADKACRDLTEKVIPNLRESLEAAEKERDFAKEEAERLLALAHDQNNELIRLREEVRTLRAKIVEMEQQEPVAAFAGVDEYGPMLTWKKHWLDLAVGADLYTLPGAQGEKK